MEKKIELVRKWLRDSGLSVNEEKTELCLFYKSNQGLGEININNVRINTMSVKSLFPISLYEGVA